ncbi:hypothetical protein [Streptomyces sp. NPDC127098]|uniref:hypothetical protein n=1 Tax=Streptomyces sp. NPDC127098 TaxID=3347137 RepID=UPI00365AB394
MPDDARDHAETLDELGRALRDFVEAEGALTRAQQVRKRAAAQVIDRVTQLREEVSAPHAPELIGVLRHIYWQQSGISSRALASAAGLHVNEMLRAIGPCPSGILCTACQEDIPRTSRSWTPPGRYGAPLCTSCEKVEQGLASRKWCVAQLRANLIGSTPVPATARDWYAAAVHGSSSSWFTGEQLLKLVREELPQPVEPA